MKDCNSNTSYRQLLLYATEIYFVTVKSVSSLGDYYCYILKFIFIKGIEVLC